MTAAPVILTRGLTKRYGDVTALEALDLEVRRGEVLGYLGPNGAGKTTTIRLLLGLSRPTAGTAEVLGRDAWRDAPTVHEHVAFVPADAALWPGLTGRETLDLLGRVHGRVDERYREELVDRFHLDTARTVRDYSRGNRQKVVLVAALMTRADLLVLDEPTSGLDPLMEVEFRRAVIEARARGQTVLLSSHVLSEVEAVCDRVAIVSRGRLVDMGTLDELRLGSAVAVQVSFAETPPDLRDVAGVEDVRVEGRTVHCRVNGQLDPLLDVLAGHHVTRLVSREASLEEVFLAHYGGSERRAGG